ncbi:uncharacterized protein LOC110888262 [Helianthus annuus]|uniref:uncharacterized protein LOC110888262 n=1 Tax=Helianthus annuus TaxID=4232 RepID=UPI000B8F461A|nr:uncharacterized protein LOC110888262 [Helianthus annuus]
MPSPASIKEMQRLAGRIVVLNRFLANHAAKSFLFISTLRNCVKKSQFQWTPEAEKAFQEMKECLIQLPTLTAPQKEEPLILYLSASDVEVGRNVIDGASNDDGTGVGLRVVSPNNHEFTYTILLDFKSTNNEAAYEAFLAGLLLAIKMGAKNLEAHIDSLLVAGQNNGLYDAKGEMMALYLEQAKALISKFQTFKVIHINQSENKHADALSKLTATSFKNLAKEVHIEVLTNPSVPLQHANLVEIGNPSWMSPIIMLFQHGSLPEGKAEARKIQNKALNYEMSDGILYRKSYMGPLLRCVDKLDA